MDVFTLVGKITMEGTEAVKSQLDGLEGNLKTVDQGFKKYDETIKTVGRAGLALAGATAAIGGASLNAAIDYESAFAGVRKTVNATEAEYAALSDGIMEMTKVLPQSATEIAAVMEAAGQLGIQNENLLSFSETMVKLGMSTNMSSTEAATSLARLANITQMPQTEFSNLGATVVALGNNLATTEGEIVDMALRLAGAGSTIGMTEAQTLGFAGALSSVGIAAEAGGTAFSKVMLEMYSAAQSGGESLTNFAAVAGMSAEEFKAKFETDAAGAISAFITGLGDMQGEGQNVLPILDSLQLGEIRVRDALLRASGATEVFTDAQGLAATAWEENNALNEEAARRVETTASQMSILKNNVSEVAINIGNALMPALKGLMEFIGPIVEKIGQFVADHPALTTAILAIAGTVGTLMASLLVASQVAKGITALKTAINGVKIALTAMRGLVATNPLLLIVTAIAAAAYLIITNWDKIKPWLQKLWNWVKPYFESIKNFFVSVFGGIKDFLVTVWDGIKAVFWAVVDWLKEWGVLFLGPIGAIIKYWDEITGFFHNLWESVKTIFSNALGAVAGFFSNAWDTIKGVWDTLVEWFKELPGKIVSALSTIYDKVTSPFKTAKDKVSEWVGNIIDWFKNLPGNIATGLSNLYAKITEKFKDAKDDVLNWLGGIGDWFKNLPANIGSWFSGLAEKIKSPFKTGINAIIDAANWLIRGLNKISFELPSWVPGVGGKSFGINISQITRLYAKGGPIPEPTLLTSLRTMKPYAIAGEAGPEDVVPRGKGGGGYGTANITVILDGKVLAKALGAPLMSEVRLKTGMRI